jgi:hypothetical protein
LNPQGADSIGGRNTLTQLRQQEGGLQMKHRTRIHYAESQKALMWERLRQGDSLQVIAQLFGRNHSSIQGILAATRGLDAVARRLNERAWSKN